MRRLVAHLRSHGIAYLALFVALGGTAYAVSLPPNSVDTKQLKNGAVTKKKIKQGAVTSAKVRDRTLKGKDFAPGVLLQGPTGPTGPAGGADTEILYAAVHVVGFATPSSIAYGKHVVSVVRTAKGKHEVTFDRDVSACAYQLTVASDVPVISLSYLGPTSAQAASKSGAPNTVMTSITQGDLTGLDAPFHLLVAC